MTLKKIMSAIASLSEKDRLRLFEAIEIEYVGEWRMIQALGELEFYRGAWLELVSEDLPAMDASLKAALPLASAHLRLSTRKTEEKTVELVNAIDERPDGSTVDDAIARLRRLKKWRHVEASSMRTMYYKNKAKMKR